MKMKVLNYTSAGCFALSSASLLFIPLLSFEVASPKSTYFLAGVFWLGLIAGAAMQILLWIHGRKHPKTIDLKKAKLVIVIAFGVSVLSGVAVICLFNNDAYALPINLFAILLSAEAYCVVKRMERLI